MDERDAPPPFSAPLRPRHLGRPPAPEWRDETITLSAADLAARRLLARARRRLGVMAAGFAAAFAAVTLKLALATLITPLRPPPPKPIVIPDPAPSAPEAAPEAHIARAEITDRNGQILAISLPTAELYANPKEMIDPAQAAHQIAEIGRAHV